MININDFYEVTEIKGIPVVSSRKMAEVFEKEHKNVLRDIDNEILNLSKIGPIDFNLLKIEPIKNRTLFH